MVGFSLSRHVLCTLIVILTILTCLIQAQGMNAIYRNYYQPNNHMEDEPDQTRADEHSQRWKPLSSRWGMPDASAHVGKVFRYTIPNDAFSGDVLRYKVTEADSDALPSWLYYDDSTAAIEGIPSEADLGQYYISVMAVGHKTNSSAHTEITEVFSINVSPEDTTRPNSAIKEDDSEVVCPKEKVPAMASIILDADWSKLTAEQRVAIVAKMSKYSMLKIGAFRLLPNGRKTAHDERVLITGPGNKPNGRFSGVSLSWKIGCGENAAHLPVVTILETAAKDNSMASQFGHDIIGWQVSGQKGKPKLRVRRQINLAGTPLPTPMPSATPTPPAETSRVSATSLTPSMSSSPIIVMTTSVVAPTPTPTPPTTTSKASTSMLTTPPTMTSTSTPVMVHTTTIGPSPSMTTTPTVMPEITTTPTMPVNQGPILNREFSRIDAKEGVPLVFVIPADTFLDEDGDTRDLVVDVLEKNGKKLSKRSWLQMDKVNQMIHGIPPATFPKGSDRQTYILEAQDSHGKSTRMPFEVVISRAEEETKPPPVTMGATLNIDFDQFMSDPALQLDILNRIASVFGDGDASAITITGIKRGSVILSWTNNTIDKDSCPTELINELMSKLVNPDGTPTQALIDAFAPDYTISGVAAMEAGACATTTPVAVTTRAPATTLAAVPTGKKKTEEGSWVGLVPAIVIVCILLLAGIITLILYRRHRKGKLSDEDNNTFINKGIPIILPDEIEEAEKPPANSSSPLIMTDEKPPLPPPEYNSVQEGSREPLLNGNENHKVSSDEDDKNSLPMTDIQKPDPPQSTPPENRKQAPVNTPGYRVPPPYVPP